MAAGRKKDVDSKNGEYYEQWVMRTRKISFIVILVGFLAYLAAMLTPYWIAYTDKEYRMTLGIFFSCISLHGKTTCGTSGGMTEGFLRASQICSPFALLAIFTATCCGMMVFYWPEVHRRRILRVAYVMSFLAAILICLVVGLYISHYKDKGHNLHAAFFVCLIGMICSPIAGILFLQDSKTMIIVEMRKTCSTVGQSDRDTLLGSNFDRFTNINPKPPLSTGLAPIFKEARPAISSRPQNNFKREISRESPSSGIISPPTPRSVTPVEVSFPNVDSVMERSAKRVGTVDGIHPMFSYKRPTIKVTDQW